MPSEAESTKEMINVGVTAKLASPIYSSGVFHGSSSTDTDTTMLHSKYKKFLNSSTPSDFTHVTNSDNSKTLYRLKTVDEKGAQKVTPSKIEFLLYRKQQRRPHERLAPYRTVRPKKSHSSMKRLLESESKSEEQRLTSRAPPARSVPRPAPAPPPPPPTDGSFVGKIKKSVRKMKANDRRAATIHPVEIQAPKVSIDIYPFDHGCAEYLRTTDCPPQIISELVALRTSDYATRFWAEFFGSLHIAVAFFLTFFLQSYRFLLQSIVKSAIVGFLQMTSDYGVKPLLTVTFNGFLQPTLIFMHNVLSSARDVVLPVAEAIGSLAKPVSGILRSVRLATVKVSHGKGAAVKDV